MIISAFECPHCHFSNNELQSASSISERGCKYSCLVTSPEDLNRQVVKSEFGTIILNELDLELPPSNSRGYLSTIEGIIGRIYKDLSDDQENRRTTAPDAYRRIQEILTRLDEYQRLAVKFTISVDDPSGCSYIESRTLTGPDTHVKITMYERTREQQEAMGFSTIDPEQAHEIDPSIFCFPATCTHCGGACDTRMHQVSIPFFKDVLIMATTCDRCGYKSNEVKSGGEIPEMGKKLALKITAIEDLSRDILKSDSCSLEIPEIDLQLGTGTLGGRFTTIEGLLLQIYDELNEKCPFALGDSADSAARGRLAILLENIKKAHSVGPFYL